MLHTHHVNKNGFVGIIEVELFGWKERMAKTKEIYYKQVGESLVERHDYEQGEATIETTISRIRSVDIKCDEVEIKSIDELMGYRDGISIINEISPFLLNGISLAKK